MSKTHKPPKHQPRGRGNTTVAESHAHAQAQQSRGWLLTLAIVLVIINGLLTTLVAYSDLTTNGLEVKSLYLPILMITSAAGFIGGMAMWFWKYWGFQLYIAASLVAATAALMNTGSMLVLFAGVLPPIIVAYIVLPKRNLFD